MGAGIGVELMKKENRNTLIFIITIVSLICFMTIFIIILSLYTSLEFVFGSIGAFSTALFGLWQFNKTKKLEIEARLFQNKAEAYQEIIKMLFELFKDQKNPNKKMSDEQLSMKILKIREKLTIWASGEVIRAFANLEHKPDSKLSEDETGVLLITKLAFLYSAIRKDLGHNDQDNIDMEIALSHLISDDREKIQDTILNNK